MNVFFNSSFGWNLRKYLFPKKNERRRAKLEIETKNLSYANLAEDRLFSRSHLRVDLLTTPLSSV